MVTRTDGGRKLAPDYICVPKDAHTNEYNFVFISLGVVGENVSG